MDQEKQIFKGVVNAKKLKYLLEALEQKDIKDPRQKDIMEIFEKNRWKISSSQAWQYKRKATEEIRKKERLTNPTTP
jgi:hypothetical protein